MYVLDTNSLSTMLKNYYRSRFITLWQQFDDLVKTKQLISVREVKHELGSGFDDATINQLRLQNNDFFADPSGDELKFITEIYKVQHFQQNLEKKKMLTGGFFADPFIIAKAKIIQGIVVTEEAFPKNGARIPNICDHFEIECMNLEGLMVRENWKF